MVRDKPCQWCTLADPTEQTRAHLVDVVHEDTLVLEDVTLALHVQVVVEVVVDLALLAVLAEEAPEDALPPHPEDLCRHSRLGGTLSLSGSGVSAGGLGSLHVAGACSGAGEGAGGVSLMPVPF